MPITRRGLAVITGLAVVGILVTGYAAAQKVLQSSTSSSRSIASVSWTPGSHIRVYSSDGGKVTEKGWDGNGPWYAGGFNAPGQAVTATSWLDPAVHIRVYIVDDGSTVEYCWDDAGPWYKGVYRQ